MASASFSVETEPKRLAYSGIGEMRVYYFTKTCWALDSIEHRRLKVCRFGDLNDPFELFSCKQSDKDRRRTFRRWVTSINEQIGLLCFSSSWRESLMWSHYSDRHKGLCLGFDVTDESLR